MPLPESATSARCCTGPVSSPATSGSCGRAHTVPSPGSGQPPWIQRHSTESRYPHRQCGGSSACGASPSGAGSSADPGPATGAVSPRAVRHARARSTARPPATSSAPTSSIARPPRSTAARTVISPVGTGPRISTVQRESCSSALRRAALDGAHEQRRGRTGVLGIGRPGPDRGGSGHETLAVGTVERQVVRLAARRGVGTHRVIVVAAAATGSPGVPSGQPGYGGGVPPHAGHSARWSQYSAHPAGAGPEVAGARRPRRIATHRASRMRAKRCSSAASGR